MAEHVRHELISLARDYDPVDQVVQVMEENRPHALHPEIDADAVVLADTYRLPADVWTTLCRRAAASHATVSEYVHGELVRMARHPTIDDSMWELGEIQAADPSLEIDFDEVQKAMRHARGLD